MRAGKIFGILLLLILMLSVGILLPNIFGVPGSAAQGATLMPWPPVGRNRVGRGGASQEILPIPILYMPVQTQSVLFITTVGADCR